MPLGMLERNVHSNRYYKHFSSIYRHPPKRRRQYCKRSGNHKVNPASVKCCERSTVFTSWIHHTDWRHQNQNNSNYSKTTPQGSVDFCPPYTGKQKIDSCKKEGHPYNNCLFSQMRRIPWANIKIIIFFSTAFMLHGQCTRGQSFCATNFAIKPALKHKRTVPVCFPCVCGILHHRFLCGVALYFCFFRLFLSFSRYFSSCRKNNRQQENGKCNTAQNKNRPGCILHT